MALRQIVETAIAAVEIIRRRICTLSGSYAELPGLPRELKSAALSSCHEVPYRSRLSRGPVIHSRQFPNLVALTASAHIGSQGARIRPCWLLKSPVTWLIVPAFAESPAAGPGARLCDARGAPPFRALGQRSSLWFALVWNIHSCLKPSRNRRLRPAFL